MLNFRKILTLIAIVASVSAVSALADNGTTPTPPKPSPTPSPKPTPTPPPPPSLTDGRCRFEGTFDSGKGDTFTTVCRARGRAHFESNGGILSDDRHGDEFLEVSCDGQMIYDDGIHVRILRDHGQDDRRVNVVIRGDRDWSPRIFIEDVNLRDLNDPRGHDENHDLRAVLKYTMNGYRTTLYGRCDLRNKDPRN